jgi:hypothetical protein
MFFLDKTGREFRKNICDKCEKKNDKKCSECGCYLIALQKVSFWSCPLKKW